MANTKISQLTALTNPTWNEEFVYALNNANGKVTLDTMKTYTQTWTQEELVSWTNIKTINNQSLLWSWNLDMSWWITYTAWTWIDVTWWVISNTWVTSVNWQTWAVTVSWWWSWWYDCVVAADWTWDYTTINAAVTAWKINIFVKNWNYTESEWRNATWWKLKVTWESREWVKVTIPANCNPATSTYFIYLSNSPAYLYISNIDFTITFDNIVSLIHNTSNFSLRVENCKFSYTKSNNNSFDYLFYCTWVLSSYDMNIRTNFVSWIYDCEFYTESDTVVIWYWDAYFSWCIFNTWASAWEINFRYWDNLLEDCRIDAFKLDWWNYAFNRCDINIKTWWLIWESNNVSTPYQFDIKYIRESEVTIWANLTQNILFQTWLMDKCSIVISDTNMTVQIWWNVWENNITYTANSFINAGWVSVDVSRSMFNSRINCSSLTLGGNTNNQRYNWIFTESSTVTFAWSDAQYTWIVLDWWDSWTPWTLNITWSYSMITWNSFRFYTVTDSWTWNVKANNVWQS